MEILDIIHGRQQGVHEGESFGDQGLIKLFKQKFHRVHFVKKINKFKENSL